MTIFGNNGVRGNPERRPKLRSRRVSVVTIVLGFLFFAAGIVAFWFMTVSPLILYFTARQWVEVPATVISSSLEQSRSRSHSRHGSRDVTTYRIAIAYEYRYDGKSFTGDRYDITRSRSFSNIGVEDMRSIVRRHPAGRSTVCFVNPDDPAQALMDRSLPDSFYFFMAWFPLLFMGGGGVAVICGIRRLRTSRNV